jgi:hypothetical protein
MEREEDCPALADDDFVCPILADDPSDSSAELLPTESPGACRACRP